jgi:hypothetical protein
MLVEHDSRMRTANRLCQGSLAMLGWQPAQIPDRRTRVCRTHATRQKAVPEVAVKIEDRRLD